MKRATKKRAFMFSRLISLFVTFLLVVSFLLSDFTLAWFTNRYESPYTPSIEGADFTLDVNFTSQGSIVNMSSGLPVDDEEGLNYDGYELSIENIGNVPIFANIKTEVYPDQEPYSENPELILFRSGEIRYGLLLKDYQKIDQDTQNVISTTPDTERWDPISDCYIEEDLQDYECRFGAFDENIYEFLILPGEKYEFELKYWVSSGVRELDDKRFFGRIVVESAQEGTMIVSTTDANPPDLVQGMIPVIWSESQEGWEVVGDWSDAWYNYGDQPQLDSNSNVVTEGRQWANVITVSQSDIGNYLLCQAVGGCSILPEALGEVVPEEEITSHFVWIPRFRYTVRSNITSGSEGVVDVVWEHGVEERFEGSGIYSGATPTNFYTSSAFLEGDRQTKGFWASKFQLGDGPGHLVSKPDKAISLESQVLDEDWHSTISSTFQSQGQTFFGLNYQNFDRAQQIRGSHWDAIAFLSQSRYGKFGATNETVLPNNHINLTMETKNEIEYTFRREGSQNQGGTTETVSSISTIESLLVDIRTGYSCGAALLGPCLNYDHDHVQTSVFHETTYDETGGGQNQVIETTADSDHFTTETLSTNSVPYSDPIFGGSGSTTGNIYGVYDMAMAREELTSTVYTQTGLHHTSIAGLESLNTFPIPDTIFGMLYVSEDGKVYDEEGNIEYDDFLNQINFGVYEYIINNTNGFDFSTYDYFANFYHEYTVGGEDLVVKKGSTSYMFDNSLNGQTMYGARVEHNGAYMAYVSRGGGLSGEIGVDFRMRNVGLENFVPTYDVEITRSSSLAPQLGESGIFAQYSERIGPFFGEATSDPSASGEDDGEGEFTYNVSGVDDSQFFEIFKSSRVTIVV